jgi:hypothetical protein
MVENISIGGNYFYCMLFICPIYVIFLRDFLFVPSWFQIFSSHLVLEHFKYVISCDKYNFPNCD